MTALVSRPDAEPGPEPPADRLADLEALIFRARESAEAAWLSMARALLEIRRDRLYLAVSDSFQRYAVDRIGLSQAHAYQLTYGAAVADVIVGAGEPLPPGTAAHALRELGPALRDDPESIPGVWRRAIKASGGNAPTAAIVRAALAEAGGRLAAASGPKPPRLKDVRDGLQGVTRKVERMRLDLSGRMLPREQREHAARLAQDAYRIGDALQAFADADKQRKRLARIEPRRTKPESYRTGATGAEDEDLPPRVRSASPYHVALARLDGAA